MDLNNENKKNHATIYHKKGVVNVKKNVSESLKTTLTMTHDQHLDSIIDVTKGKAQLGPTIGSDKHYKEVSTLALDVS